MAEEIDADDGAGAQFAVSANPHDAGFEVGDIHLEGVGVDIDEHGRRTEEQRHLGGRGIGERREENGVTRADVLGHHGDEQRVGAGTDGDAVGGVSAAGEFGFEFGDFRPEHELAMGEDGVDAAPHLGADAGLLRAEVEKRHRQAGGRCRGGALLMFQAHLSLVWSCRDFRKFRARVARSATACARMKVFCVFLQKEAILAVKWPQTSWKRFFLVKKKVQIFVYKPRMMRAVT